jgi:peptidoglycan DL-endopeptidase CwlO
MTRNIYKIIISLCFIISYTAQSQTQKDKNEIIQADSIVNFATKYLGTPYKWAGNSEEGFDCSGFVSFVFGHFNIALPRSSEDYSHVGSTIKPDDCQKGDIILFSGTDYNKSIIGHVGIITTEKGTPIKFIHSSSSKNHWGVVITDFSNSNYQARYIGIRRIKF